MVKSLNEVKKDIQAIAPGIKFKIKKGTKSRDDLIAIVGDRKIIVGDIVPSKTGDLVDTGKSWDATIRNISEYSKRGSW